MSSRPRGLGRGLGALIPPTTGATTTAPPPAATPEEGVEQAALRPATRHLAMPEALVDTTARMRQRPVVGPRPGAEGPAGAPTGLAGAEMPEGSLPALGDASSPSAVPGAQFAEIPIDAISANPLQPREVFDEDAQDELVQSIREVGLLQPIVVRPHGTDRYELVMGERRWRASRAAGLVVIPAIVRNTGDDHMLLDALLENLHRVQLNALEEAAAYEQLLREFGCTHEQLADRIGRSRSQVTNTIRLLKLPPPVQRRVAAGVLSAGHARALLSLEDAEQQDRLAYRIVAEGLSVRAVEEIVALGEPTKAHRRPRAGRRVNPGLAELATRLSDRFETRVKVDLGQKRGKIVIEFASVDDLQRIVTSMAPGDGSILRGATAGLAAEDPAAAEAGSVAEEGE